jgi:DNA-binding SARP family transcriptional activator
MEFRILGPLEVREEGRALEITRPKELAFLSILLLHSNEVLPVERLVDELWGLEPPAKPSEAIQELVYQLRKKLEAGRPRGSVLMRQGEGYKLSVSGNSLDLHRFESLLRHAEEAKRSGDLGLASSTLAEALAIWRGPPLANVVCNPDATTKAEIGRLEELRLSVLIDRIRIDLELGEEGEIIGELETLIAQHPLDERLRSLLMLALYRAGRQADALDVYQETRTTLLDQLGIEPSRQLKEIQQRILRQDPELDPSTRAGTGNAPVAAQTVGDRAIVVAALKESDLDPLIAVAEPLGRSQLGRELILALVVDSMDGSSPKATASVNDYRARLRSRGTESRAAAFASPAPAEDLARLANRESVDLLLMSCESELLESKALSSLTTSVLATAPCDVALLTRHAGSQHAGPVLVPFGGLTHDWAALELAAWAADAAGLRLTLIGTRGGPGRERDASRLLADASLLVQAFLGISADVQLLDPGPEGILRASDHAALLVVGLPERWRQDGIGDTRLELARNARAPVLLMRKGTRPGGLAPRDTTAFAWSLTTPGLKSKKRSPT